MGQSVLEGRAGSDYLGSEFFEVLLPDGAQKFGLVEDIVVERDVLVHAPNKFGLGYAIDFALIERNKIAVLE
jgi:hypothetical protein